MVRSVGGGKVSRFVQVFSEKVGKLGNHVIKKASASDGDFAKLIKRLMAFLGVKPQAKSEHKGSPVPPKAKGTAQKANVVAPSQIVPPKAPKQPTFAQLVEAEHLPEVEPSPLGKHLETAGKGGPATEVFESVKTDPEGTKAAAKDHCTALKKQIESQLDHGGINGLGRKLGISFDVHASFSEKVKQAKDAIDDQIVEAGRAKEEASGQLLEGEKLQGQIGGVAADSEKRSKRKDDNDAAIDRKTAEMGEMGEKKLALGSQLEKVKTDRVVLKRETKTKELDDQISNLDQDIIQIRDGIKRLIVNNETIDKENLQAQADDKSLRRSLEDLDTKAIEDQIDLQFRRLTTLDQGLDQLTTIRREAGKDSEELLKQLLNSYILHQAVESYSLYFTGEGDTEAGKAQLIQSFHTTTPQGPDQVLDTFKIMMKSRDQLRQSFLAEIAESGIILPDGVLVQLKRNI